MKVYDVAIRRPVTTLMMIVSMLILGIVSFSKLQLDLLPKLDLPVAAVSINYTGAGPEEIETMVTKPLERVLSTAGSLKNISTISSEENCLIILEFNNGTNMDFATLEIREKLDLVKAMLPDNIEDPIVLKINPNDFQSVMRIGVSGNNDSSALKSIVEQQIVKRLERINGVASVPVMGGSDDEVHVVLSPESLLCYGIAQTQVMQLLSTENMDIPGGVLASDKINQSVKTKSAFSSLEDIRNLPIPSTAGTAVKLRELGTVSIKNIQRTGESYINGVPAITMSIKKQSTSNMVMVASKVNKELEKLKNEFPELRIHVIYDSSRYIKMALATVGKTAVIGGFLAIAILYLFMRNFKATLIVATAIPVSVIGTFVFMYFCGMTLNLISLGGLALGIGMLVDNAIVIIENIERQRHLEPDIAKAASIGTQEVGNAVLASTLTTVAVFLPIAFVDGMAAKIFKEMALTVSFSLLVSLLVAVTFVPMIFSKIIPASCTASKSRTVKTSFKNSDRPRILDGIKDLYGSILFKAIKYRYRTILGALVVLLVTVISVFTVGMEYFPAFDEGEIEVTVQMPAGTSLAQTSAMVKQIEEKIKHSSYIKGIHSSVGDYNGYDGTGGFKTDCAVISIDIGKIRERKETSESIAEDFRNATGSISGAIIKVNSRGNSMGTMLTNQPVSLDFFGDDLDTLKRIAERAKDIIGEIDGTREVECSWDQASAETIINVSRDTAAFYGMTASSVANTVQTAVEGRVVTRYKTSGDELDVRVFCYPEIIRHTNELEGVPVISPIGQSLPLSSLAAIFQKQGPVSISRYNNKRTVSVSADIVGRDLNSISKDIEKKLDGYIFPDGYSWDFSGQKREMDEAFDSLKFALILSVLIVYMVLASQFESLTTPFIIMLSVPLALTGALMALFITGRILSIPAFIGIIMLGGIVVNNAIVLVDTINRKRKEGMDRRTAILEAGCLRIRPILMTSLTTILAMVPMALGIGEGSESQAPLATAVIGGLTLSTFVTLVVIPVIYMVFDDAKRA